MKEEVEQSLNTAKVAEEMRLSEINTAHAAEQAILTEEHKQTVYSLLYIAVLRSSILLTLVLVYCIQRCMLDDII
jgi:hypothetical protein